MSIKPIIRLFILTVCALALPIHAEPAADTSLSPYFVVLATDGEKGTEQLPLKSTRAEVRIAGVIADVVVTQTYGNHGTKTINATYVFPGSTRAAVHGLEMQIGERRIEAAVKERGQAAATFEAAKKAGKSAALLNQERPNVFQMNVANILPGDEIRVVLRYTELLVPTENIYEFVFPTVVGPRYSDAGSNPVSDAWVANPYLSEGVEAPSPFDIKITLDAGMPLQEVSCRTHATKIDYATKNRATIALDPQSTEPANNRDFVLRYRLAGTEVAPGLLLHRGKEGEANYFALMVEPPARLQPAQIPPRDFVFIVDVSGSMNGFPLDIAKQLMQELVSTLRPEDTFNVLLFAGTANLLSPRSLPATTDNLTRAMDLLDRQEGSGGTELLTALQTALALPAQENTARSLLVITDGFVSCEARAFDLIRGNLARANLFAFGIGSSVNRHLIEGLAHVGQGEPFVVLDPKEAPARAKEFRTYISSPALTRVKVAFDGFDTYDVEPASVPDVLAARPILVQGKWKGDPRGRIVLTGQSGDGPFSRTIEVAPAAENLNHPALGRLWARKRIQLLGDYNLLQQTDERVKEITSLGLTHHLLTAFTSFVAVDDVVRNPGAVAKTIKQPLPLPSGVSNLAVGNTAATPEPETWMLFAVVAALVGWHLHRQRRKTAA
jgi:Ca-activated chloride channel family protein